MHLSRSKIISFEVVPNPANTIMRINYDGLSGSSTFTLCNALGMPSKTVSMSVSGSQTIDVSSLPVGVYWLKAETAGKPIKTTKVLIVR